MRNLGKAPRWIRNPKHLEEILAQRIIEQFFELLPESVADMFCSSKTDDELKAKTLALIMDYNDGELK